MSESPENFIHSLLTTPGIKIVLVSTNLEEQKCSDSMEVLR